MRMIGHQLLLSLGDSSSRVLPVQKMADRYTIRFEREFAFSPAVFESIIDSVINATQISESYIVSVVSCDSLHVVHSYEVGLNPEKSVLACRSRNLPEDCYSLVITLMDVADKDAAIVSINSSSQDSSNRLYAWLGLVTIALASGAGLYLLKRKKNVLIDPNVINIGKYRFNKRKMELWFNEEKIELTSKECDLLQLLCDSTNDTVERETILRMVWGDEGDYVGRTLDVFISKLRKKLEGDSSVKIANIRGVGYKLVVEFPN